METTKLSSKGQVIIPKPFRTAHHWEPGQELVVINTGDGILLKPKAPFQKTNLNDVASCLQYSGTPKTEEEIEKAIKKGMTEHFFDSH